MYVFLSQPRDIFSSFEDYVNYPNRLYWVLLVVYNVDDEVWQDLVHEMYVPVMFGGIQNLSLSISIVAVIKRKRFVRTYNLSYKHHSTKHTFHTLFYKLTIK